jgi:hypothetical protein
MECEGFAAARILPECRRRRLTWRHHEGCARAPRPASPSEAHPAKARDFNFDQVSAATRRSDRNSLLNWMASLIST